MNGNQRFLKDAKKYLKQSEKDLREARRAFDKKKYDKCSLLAGQAAMNALTSINIARNQYRVPAYNLGELLRVSLKYDASLSDLEEVCLNMDSVHEKTFFTSLPKQANTLNETDSAAYLSGAEKIILRCGKSLKNFITME